MFEFRSKHFEKIVKIGKNSEKLGKK